MISNRLPPEHLRLGLPSGSMQASTIELFGRAGYKVSVDSRSVFPRVDDDRISAVLFRAQEMSRYVNDGIIDCGLTGYDWVVENGNEHDVHEIIELTYSRATTNPARWVLCVPEDSPIKTAADFAGKLIATELVNVTKRYFADRGVDGVAVEFSWGTTEVKAGIVDGIVDVTETGSSIKANNLRVIDTLLTSTIRFIANKTAWSDPTKREKMENIAMLLKGAIEARAKVGLKMNCPESKLAEITDSCLPRKARRSPAERQRLGRYRGDSRGKAGTRIDPSLEAGGRDWHFHLPFK